MKWDVAHGTSVAISPGPSRLFGAQGSVTVSPSESQVYKLKAAGPGGVAHASCSVTVDPTVPTRRAVLSLDKIEVFEDGSGGTTRWTFEVSSEGRRLFTLPRQYYGDREAPRLLTRADGASALVRLSEDGSIRLEVSGKRVSNHPASGKGSISFNRPNLAMTVRHPTKPKEGHFAFHFSLREL